jgi:ABC-type sugar transport system substrate-binding protein
MQLSKIRAGLGVLVVVGLVLAGCASPAKSSSASGGQCTKTYTIGFSHPAGESVYAATLRNKVVSAGTANGCVKVLIDNTRNENLQTQVATIQSWVTQKINAIVVLPVDANSLEGLRKQAQAQGTKWLTYASPIPGADGSIGFDSVQSGDMIAKDAVAWYRKNYPNGGATAAVTTSTSLPAFAGRWTQPLSQFAAAGIQVVSKQDCGTQACGLQIAGDALRAHPDLRVFIGVNDDAAIGALKAFTNAGINPNTVYIAGQDGTKEGLQAVKQGGAYKASAAIQLDVLGQAIVDAAMAAITGKGKTTAQIGTVLAKNDNPTQLDQLIASFTG